MIRIAFTCGWNESSQQLLDRYAKQTPGCKGIWKSIQGVSDLHQADYCVVLERVRDQQVLLRPEKVIYIKREPDFINNHLPDMVNVIKWHEQHCGITWWLNKTYDELNNAKYPVKTHDVSCIVSSKHKTRERYVKRICGDLNSDIHLYGRGHDPTCYGRAYRGELNYDGKCKSRGLLNYKYSIALENSQQKNYFTEKFADAILSWTVPVYWGCPNISDYFPEGSYQVIDINSNNPVKDIHDIIKHPVNHTALKIARDNILGKYNIWEIIHTYIYNLER